MYVPLNSHTLASTMCSMLQNGSCIHLFLILHCYFHQSDSTVTETTSPTPSYVPGPITDIPGIIIIIVLGCIVITLILVILFLYLFFLW